MHNLCRIRGKAGNMLKKTINGKTTTFTFDGANQLVSSTTDGVTTQYAYDAAGRLVKEDDKTYRYGYLDKVLSVTEGERTYTYDYHVDGQLARADYGNGGRAGCPQPAGSEDFLWDGLALIKRGDERFVNEPHVGGGNPVASSKGTTYFNDMLGTTVGAKRGFRRGFRGQTLMVGFGWWGCAKLWSNVRHEAVAQLQDQPVLPSDQPHCQPRVLPE